jgi:hypothetical protein
LRCIESIRKIKKQTRTINLVPCSLYYRKSEVLKRGNIALLFFFFHFLYRNPTKEEKNIKASNTRVKKQMQPTPAGSSNTSAGGGSAGGGGGGGIARFRSAPATWIEALLGEEEEDPLKQSQNLTQLLTSNTPSSRDSVPFNASSAAVEPGLFEPVGGFQRQNSSPTDFLRSSGIGSDQGYFSSYGNASNYEYMTPNMDVSPSDKRAREVELQNPSARYPPPPSVCSLQFVTDVGY